MTELRPWVRRSLSTSARGLDQLSPQRTRFVNHKEWIV
jgi:hypothetical protein